MTGKTHISGGPHKLGLHDSVSAALMEMIRDHQPRFPTMSEIAERAGQDEAAVRKVFGSVQDILDTCAEQGLVRLFDTSVRLITQAPHDDAVAQFRAVGRAYLTWAFDNPTYFMILQSNKLVDLDGNESLRRYTESMRELMLRLLRKAHDDGLIVNDLDPEVILVTGRSLLLGLGRMGIEQNMESWHPGVTAQEAAFRSFDDYVRMVADAASNTARYQASAGPRAL